MTIPTQEVRHSDKEMACGLNPDALGPEVDVDVERQPIRFRHRDHAAFYLESLRESS
jgi:hypothetical protein